MQEVKNKLCGSGRLPAWGGVKFISNNYAIGLCELEQSWYGFVKVGQEQEDISCFKKNMRSYFFYRSGLSLKGMGFAGAVLVTMAVVWIIYMPGLQKKDFLPNKSIKETKQTVEMKPEFHQMGSLVNKSSEKIIKPEKLGLERPPMVLGIGMKKCGTRGVQDFLNIHPYFKNGERFTQIEFFYMYKRHPKSLLPGDIRDFYGEDAKNLKAIMVICNPVDRFFSDFVHIHEAGIKAFPEQFQEVGKRKSVSEYVRYAMKSFSEEVLPRLGDVTEVINCTEFSRLMEENRHLDPVMKGLFVYYVKDWITTFPKENILVVNGEDLIEAPWTVLQNIEKFLQIDPFFSKDLFHFDEKRGFYCPEKCLQGGKGRTRSKHGSMKKYEDLTNEDREVLRAFYAQYNSKLFDMLGIRYAW